MKLVMHFLGLLQSHQLLSEKGFLTGNSIRVMNVVVVTELYGQFISISSIAGCVAVLLIYGV